MNDNQKKYLLRYLQDMEKEIENAQQNLIDRASYRGISLACIASEASDLISLQVEQRTICWTLRQMGYYVEYEEGHAKDIVHNEEEE